MKRAVEYAPREQMISEREVIRKYKRMLELDSNQGDADPNKVNCYRCTDDHCGHITKTIDRDRGTTPFMFKCEKCGHWAKSSFYSDIAPHVKPTIEWYRPSLDETLKMRRKPAQLEHILMGGLEYRRIES